MSKITQTIAATISFGVCGVIIYWGILASSLDPQKVPVIRKTEGPARIAPEEPGGEQASHQGLAVNEVQSNGSASDTAERVVLAPQNAVLTEEDLSVTQMLQVKLEEEATRRAAKLAEQQVQEPETPNIPLLIGETAPSFEATEQAVVEAEPEVGPAVLIPKKRPRTYTPKKKVVVELPKPLETVAAGTKLIQLGAFDSPSIADQQWRKMLGRHGDLLGGKRELIQKAQRGGRTFYRLRAVGFDSSNEAKSLCSALTARGTACLAVTAR